jgi:hypothetical protein
MPSIQAYLADETGEMKVPGWRIFISDGRGKQ